MGAVCRKGLRPARRRLSRRCRRRQKPSQQTAAVGPDSDPTDLDPETQRLVPLCVPAAQGGGGERTWPSTASRPWQGGRWTGRGDHGLADGFCFAPGGGIWALRPGRPWRLEGSVICEWAGCVGCGRGGGGSASGRLARVVGLALPGRGWAGVWTTGKSGRFGIAVRIGLCPVVGGPV